MLAAIYHIIEGSFAAQAFALASEICGALDNSGVNKACVLPSTRAPSG
jgi:hypothetical protein